MNKNVSMQAHEKQSQPGRTIADEIAENEAREVAVGEAGRDPWAEFTGTDPATIGIARAARFHRESENLTSESLTGEELEAATHIIKSLLEAEHDLPLGGGYYDYDGPFHDRRHTAYINGDLCAIFAVRIALGDEHSVEAARSSILNRYTQRPSLVFEQRSKYGKPVRVTNTLRTVLPDGSISPFERVTDGQTYDCTNFYIDHRALQYLDYMIEHPDDIREMINSEEPELPEVFQGPLYVGEHGEILNTPNEMVTEQ